MTVKGQVTIQVRMALIGPDEDSMPRT